MQEMQESRVQSLGWEDHLEGEMATHSSILAWRIPWTEEPGRLQSMGLQKSQTQLKCLSTTLHGRNLGFYHCDSAISKVGHHPMSPFFCNPPFHLVTILLSVFRYPVPCVDSLIPGANHLLILSSIPGREAYNQLVDSDTWKTHYHLSDITLLQQRDMFWKEKMMSINTNKRASNCEI